VPTLVQNKDILHENVGTKRGPKPNSYPEKIGNLRIIIKVKMIG